MSGLERLRHALHVYAEAVAAARRASIGTPTEEALVKYLETNLPTAHDWMQCPDGKWLLCEDRVLHAIVSARCIQGMVAVELLFRPDHQQTDFARVCTFVHDGHIVEHPAARVRPPNYAIETSILDAVPDVEIFYLET